MRAEPWEMSWEINPGIYEETRGKRRVCALYHGSHASLRVVKHIRGSGFSFRPKDLLHGSTAGFLVLLLSLLTPTNFPLDFNKSLTASTIPFLSLWNGNKNLDLHHIL